MASNAVPKFTDGGRVWVNQVTTANANRDGTGTIAVVATAGPAGSLIELVRVQAVGTTTAGMIRLYINDGTNTRLLKEIAVTAATPSATVQAFSAEFIPTEPLVLPTFATPALTGAYTFTNYSLRASTENTETFNIIASGGDY